jgi:hypothetical protein
MLYLTIGEKMSKKILLAVLITLLICPSVQGHRPLFTDEKGVDAKTSVKIANPDTSQVIYRILTNDTPQLWLAIDAKKDYELFVQIGIPVIDRLKSFRPSFVVIGPGLPGISVPFSIPMDTGGKDFPTKDIKKPRFFHEHYTKTDSWILTSEKIVLPETGRYYVIAYSPLKDKGKFWLSVGQKENFGFMDLFRFGQWKKTIQKFHEVGSNSKETKKRNTKRKSYTIKSLRKWPGHRR